MEGPPVALLVFIFIFFLLAPDASRPNSPHQQREFNILIQNEQHALETLNRTRYGDFNPSTNKWLNITGLRKEDNYAWSLLPKVRERAIEQAEAILLPWNSFELGDRYKSTKTLDGGVVDIREATPTTVRDAVPFYQNITGLVHGQWVRSKLANDYRAPVLNLTELSPRVPYVTEEYNRNITGSEGELSIRLDEKKSTYIRMGASSVRDIKAELTIKDDTSSGDGWDITLHGVHFPESGSVILTTTGDKFDGIFALPHLARSEATSLLAKELLNRTISEAIGRQVLSESTSSFPWASLTNNPADMMFPSPHCEFIIYMQQKVIWPHSPQLPYDKHGGFPTYLEHLEQELRQPTGASLPKVQDMEFSTMIFSPDCGFVLESKGPPDFSPTEANHLRGPKSESFYQNIRLLVEVLAVILGCQIWLLKRQMKDASTPSTRSRISFYTVSMMALGDGFVFLSFMAVNMLTDAVFLIVAGTSFLAFLSVSFFGMKFLIDIWVVQAPERLEQERERQRAERERRQYQPAAIIPAPTETVPTNPVPTTTTSNDTLPLPATAPRPAADLPIIIPSDQDIDTEIADNVAAVGPVPTPAQPTVGSTRREMGAMYSRFYFVLIGILFLSLNATTWPTTLRSIYTNSLAFLYLSFWLPQIRRNIQRNCRKALRWEFVAGHSLLRFLPILYFYTVEDNIFFAKTDTWAAWALAAWLWLQVWALLSQEILGPRFFVPNGWAPPAYDYHPVLREDDDEEAGASMPLGFTQATADESFSPTVGESKERGRKVFDCAICMQDIDVHVVAASGGGGSGGENHGEDSTEREGSGLPNLFTRRAYMVTPCRHIFHSPCLEGWMRYKLQCPICRESLPPL